MDPLKMSGAELLLKYESLGLTVADRKEGEEMVRLLDDASITTKERLVTEFLEVAQAEVLARKHCGAPICWINRWIPDLSKEKRAEYLEALGELSCQMAEYCAKIEVSEEQKSELPSFEVGLAMALASLRKFDPSCYFACFELIERHSIEAGSELFSRRLRQLKKKIARKISEGENK